MINVMRCLDHLAGALSCPHIAYLEKMHKTHGIRYSNKIAKTLLAE